MKYIILVPDGMADEPLDVLGNKTPLEAAQTPNMDFMAQNGFSGMVQTIPDGMPPGSDIGNLALLGYDPTKKSFKFIFSEVKKDGIVSLPEVNMDREGLLKLRKDIDTALERSSAT